jgi:CHAT domain-containing protein
MIAPFTEQLRRKRLVIVADGALQYIPFGSLRTPQGSPLIADHEIVNAPSASTLALLRQEAQGRKPAPKVVAVLADPVFDRHDPRLSRYIGPPTAPPSWDALERSSKESGVLKLDRLAATRAEAKGIVSLAGKPNSMTALDFDASRQTALSPELEQYRIVHFASHALINSQHPELSGMVLSLVDRLGEPQDGFLRTPEIYNLKLNADLVVLSACQTALGKEVKGEGLIGLTRGFMYAGAPRVVASLWRVSDRATAELMKRFYKAMLSEGQSPAAALQRAQVEIARQKRWSAPYYWAGFVLQGEWK